MNWLLWYAPFNISSVGSPAAIACDPTRVHAFWANRHRCIWIAPCSHTVTVLAEASTWTALPC